MCGICGEISLRGPLKQGAVESMAKVLGERGPDGSGLYVQNNVALAHRRLSILDISPRGHQPMVDPVLGLTIAFNGCIYNFRELRAELEAKSHRFFSDSDTEVILKAYAEWGPRCVERLRGMFAFAILERDTGKVVIARDRLGIKPLYFARTADRILFSSTLPSLLAAGDVDTAIDPVALHQYMSFHGVAAAPRTILKGVRKLAPATLWTIHADGRETEEVYWRVTIGAHANTNSSLAEHQDQVLATLRRAVERRRVADVPTGVFLSGGVDSSLIVALLAEAGETVNTFSVGFESVGGVVGDEFVYSDFIARHYGTRHQKHLVTAAEALAAMPGAISAMSEPMVSHDSVGFYLLSQQATRDVKVVQSGQGADEVFGGYHWYPKMADANDAAERYEQLYFDRTHDEMREILSPDLVGANHSRAFVEDFFARHADASPVDQALQLDTDVMLVDDPVKRVDNMTMAWGLEARVPFLDHDLVELAARIPAPVKMGDGGKQVLKDAARRILPARVIDRPKGYFPMPSLKYLRGPFLEKVRDVLNQKAARERGLFNRAYVDRLLAAPDEHLTPKGNSKLWQVASLEWWLQARNI